ncbi:hypothetical protein [Microbacterium phyllosphaerae]|uniref:hypothetical protein n=1 Tax=Microbacterium phyllosphaerae TaxID=124798 RepID=UPI0021694DBE|nr:hypothetical protein [Microbacterium phyllosphaerae]MCS3442186.1 hypothetical protein [Microbacterium phyllosphaerae]
MTKNQPKNRKRAIVAGASILLLAGITTGGALVTSQSTIFDNIFQTEAGTVVDGELLVTGDAMNHSFQGAVDGELTTKYYVLTNTSPTMDATVNIASLVHDKTTNNADLLTQNLDTRIAINGDEFDAGKLASMDLGANLITVAAGESVKVRMDVYVANAAAFQAANIGDDAEAQVDFQFDAIFN